MLLFNFMNINLYCLYWNELLYICWKNNKTFYILTKVFLCLYFAVACSFNQVSLQWNTETQTRTYHTTKKSCESSTCWTWYLVEHNLTIQYIRIISSACQRQCKLLPSLGVRSHFILLWNRKASWSEIW